MPVEGKKGEVSMVDISTPIEFRQVEGKSLFLDPRKEYQLTEEKLQVRYDPLTGRTGHFVRLGAVKPQRLPIESYSSPEVKGFCPFCSDLRYRATPKFPDYIFPDGRLSKGEALLIPNLYPYDVYSAITIMTTEHVVPLERLNEKVLLDSFSIGVAFLKRIKSIDPSLPYHLTDWNYMPPSGGGLVHPHQQCFATQFPGNQVTDEMRCSKAFYKKHGVNYWKELVRIEQHRDKRYIGSTDSSHWLASFVSLGVLGEIIGIFPDVYSIDDFNEAHISELVSGVRRIFSYYVDKNIFSFNTSLLFGPENQDFFSAHFRIIPRTFLNTRDHASDLCFYQALHQEPVCVVMPEVMCKEVRAYFIGKN
jgi:galactose-1-phosphate uridylyltransferase